jgi:hypothetical protein
MRGRQLELRVAPTLWTIDLGAVQSLAMTPGLELQVGI